MGITAVASRPGPRRISVAGGKPLLRGIHHLALVTDNMRMTLDFYVRVLGMPIVHGLRTPLRPPGASHAHGNGAPPYANHSFYFFDPNGIRLEISSDLDGDEEDLQVIRSCSMSEIELRAELETISTDKAWVDDMVAAMTPHGLGPVVPSVS